MTAVRAFIFVDCIKHCSICVATKSWFVCTGDACVWVYLNVFDTVLLWGRNNLTPMCCANTLQWQWRLCVYRRWMYYETVLRWTFTLRSYVCTGVLNSKVFNTGCMRLWSYYPRVMSKYTTNTLQRWWRFCIYPRWNIWNAVVLGVHAQQVRLYAWIWTWYYCLYCWYVCIGVCFYLKLLFIDSITKS